MQHAISHKLILETIECGECGIVFAIPETKLDRCRETGEHWFCPNGHCRVFRRSEIDDLRDKLKEQMRITDRYAENAKKAKAAERKTKKEMSNLKKRIHGGVCPHCKRTFQNLARHMKTKHSDCTT